MLTMAFVVDLTFPDGTLADYDAVMKESGLTGAGLDKIPGASAHYAWEEDGVLRILDIWESPEQFQANFANTIGPAAQRAGIELHPVIKISPLHYSIT
jgi:hypothetical protein